MTDFSIAPAPSNDGFDRSQFIVQADGSFKIGIRAMAGMAGIDDSSLSRSLKSAAAENALPCARSLVAQGFDPAAVSTWGATGGIPEAAAPFILEHYGLMCASPSDRARKVLLSFARVGINAYLKEKLGVSQVRDTQLPPVDVLGTVERSIDLLERLGGVDTRAQLMLKDIVMNHAARQAEGSVNALPAARMLSLREAMTELTDAKPSEATKFATKYGKKVKRLYIEENGRPPVTHKQLVNGGSYDVADYEFEWISSHRNELQDELIVYRLNA